MPARIGQPSDIGQPASTDRIQEARIGAADIAQRLAALAGVPLGRDISGLIEIVEQVLQEAREP